MDNSEVAKEISKALVEGLVNAAVDKANVSNIDVDGASESLASALESLTEESAKEIFNDKPLLSAKTTKIISAFLGKETRAFATPTPPLPPATAKESSDDDDDDFEENLVIDESGPRHSEPQVKNLDEVTFSEDSDDQASLNIAWESIESRPSSSATTQKRPQSSEENSSKNGGQQKSSSSHIMEEVVDEFADESMDAVDGGSDSQFKSTDDESQNAGHIGRHYKGRRVKAKPMKKPVPNEELINSESTKSEDLKESGEIIEDIASIVDFLQSSNPGEDFTTTKEEKEKKTAKKDTIIQKKKPPVKRTAGRKRKGKRKGVRGKRSKLDPVPIIEDQMAQQPSDPVVAEQVQEPSNEEIAVVESLKTTTTTTTTTTKKSTKRKKAGAPIDDHGPEPTKVFKPIQNWHKVIKLPSNQPLSKWTEDQIFRNATKSYVPCVPKNTSQRLIAALTDKELEQLSCPGCKDRFLLPTSFFQHIYRKSARIVFKCGPCGDMNLAFHNRCHFRTHVLSHLEVDGTNSITIPDSGMLSIAPLEESELSLGFIDDTYSAELETLHADIQIQNKDSSQCPECRISILDDMTEHLNGSEVGSSVECDECQMWLPTKCSLSAHERIHRRIPSHLCPECGAVFETWHMFKHHVQKTCHHEARVLSIECVLCGQYVDWCGVYAHLYQSHVRLYYKCTSCEKAFVEKSAIYDHRQEMHKSSEGSQIVADFSLLYKAAFLKGPHKLFSTREAFEARISRLIKSWKRAYKFKCFACQTYFESPQDLSSHNTKWCQMQQPRSEEDNWVTASKLFNNQPPPAPPPATACSSAATTTTTTTNVNKESADDNTMAAAKDLTESETYEKMNQHLANLEALSSNCHGCQRIGLDYRAHLVHHTKRGHSGGPPPQSASSAEKGLLENDDSALVASHACPRSETPIRITRQRLEAHNSETTSSRSPTPSTTVTTALMTAPIKKQPKEPPQKLSAAGGGGGGGTAGELPKKTTKLRKKSKTVVVKPFVETLGIDVLSNRQLLSFNRLNIKALAFGATASKLKPVKEENKTFNCGLCDFSSDSRDSFSTHIRIHKPVINRSSNSIAGGPAVNFNEAAEDCMQCKECGMCFASEPSWKKHLFLLHRIKRPQASDYCEDLNIGLSSSSKAAASASASKADDDEYAFNDDPDGEEYEEEPSEEDLTAVAMEFTPRRNVCNVCRRAFTSELELRRHFRSHGMAFIMQQPPPSPPPLATASASSPASEAVASSNSKITAGKKKNKKKRKKAT
jgi:hypothetical protein